MQRWISDMGFSCCAPYFTGAIKNRDSAQTIQTSTIIMTTIRHVFQLSCALCIFGGLASFAHSSEPITLFDGKSLNGWEFTKGVWRVEDGAITAGSHSNFPTTISTKNTRNFELNMKIKCSSDWRPDR